MVYIWRMEKFKEFLFGIPMVEREAFASRCGTSRAHLTNIAYGQKSCGESLAINIERESHGVVRCEDMRPDVDWAYLRGTKNRVGGTSHSTRLE